MNITSSILNILVGPKAKIFEEATKDPIKAQASILFEYLKRNENTEYGLKYDFRGIKSIKDYQEKVPLVEYEDIKGYIDRIVKGENNILTVDKSIFFGLTSGTTEEPKYIPVTAYSRNKKAQVMDLWAYYISRDHPEVLNGKVLAVVSPENESMTALGIPAGAESGHAYKNLPFIVKHLYALPHQIFDILDYEARYYCILRISMEHDITMIVTLSPSTIILLCHRIEIWKDKIIEDIHRGTIDKNIDIPDNIRKMLEKTLKPNREKAKILKKIIKEKGELLPKYFWPNMKIIGCWKAGTMKLYLKELSKFFGDIPIRDIGCVSTEARSSIPMTDEETGGALTISTNFYEFIAKEDINKKEKKILVSDQLKKDKEYFLVVTTPGGLYRYNIDDVIKVNGFFNKTPIIEFVQKGMNVSSMAGEKLYESQVNEAVNKAVEKNKILLHFFSATCQWDLPPRYIFLVEFDEEPSKDVKKRFLKSIEEELHHYGIEYEHMRKAKLLSAPILKVVEKGSFERYRAKKIGEGTHDSQFKVPELVPAFDFQDNFTIAEEILLND